METLRFPWSYPLPVRSPAFPLASGSHINVLGPAAFSPGVWDQGSTMESIILDHWAVLAQCIVLDKPVSATLTAVALRVSSTGAGAARRGAGWRGDLLGRLVLLDPSLGHFVGLPSRSCVSSPWLVSICPGELGPGVDVGGVGLGIDLISCIWDSIACSSLVASTMSSGFTVVSNMEGTVMDDLGGLGLQR
eukprot:s8429_g1.t1